VIRDLVQRITTDPSWNSLAVLCLIAVAVALIVISATAWSNRHD
jgi:hypothetical protein